MAIATIFNAYTIVTGNGASSEMVNVGDLTLQVTVAASTDNPELTFTLKAKEGTGAYVDITDDDGCAIQFTTRGNMSKRLVVKGIESESVKLYVVVGSGATGTITAQSTITAKTTA